MMQFRDIEWARWTPKERATLLFYRERGRLLMIHKKRGLGAGKLNGPGGRLEPGETPEQAAIRETQEELCVTPSGLHLAGELKFQFTNMHAIHGYVFTAQTIEGTPSSTEEADPIWVEESAIPYHRMWSDDRVWMPLVLENRFFTARFLFDGDQMLGCEVDCNDARHSPDS